MPCHSRGLLCDCTTSPMDRFTALTRTLMYEMYDYLCLCSRSPAAANIMTRLRHKSAQHVVCCVWGEHWTLRWLLVRAGLADELSLNQFLVRPNALKKTRIRDGLLRTVHRSFWYAKVELFGLADELIDMKNKMLPIGPQKRCPGHQHLQLG